MLQDARGSVKDASTTQDLSHEHIEAQDWSSSFLRILLR